MKEQNEKQAIEEMAKDVTEAIKHNSAVDVIRHGLICVNGDGIARELFDDGYRKQSVGEWTKHLDEWDCEYAKCSCCGEEFYDATGEDTIDMFYNFCPNCGARMKGGEE